MVNLDKRPFYLDEDEQAWVKCTLKGMSTKEKVEQLFLIIGQLDYEDDALQLYHEVQFGGIMFRPGPAAKLKRCNEKLQKTAKIPLLIAANLEAGGHGALLEGTNFGSQLQVAATGETKQAYRLGEISCHEAAAVGVNLAFAPVCDIDRNWRNPITNTRTYGRDPDAVINMCSAYIEGAGENNVAVSIKHFPGDGCDERDQHLVSSVNDLTCEEWDATYGRVYQHLIDQGAQTVMAGHILQPSYTRRFNPKISDGEMMPASCSKELIQDLLRKKLGFEGVVLTDAANMLGYCAAMKRSELIPATINAGVDMILFGRNLREDISYLLKAVEQGTVAMKRLDEAVTRVLALKASLKLHKKEHFVNEMYKEIIASPKNQEMAWECADKAITLVKDSQNLLPVTPETHKRVWLLISGDKPGFTGGSSCAKWVIEALERSGFQVTLYDSDHTTMEETTVAIEAIKKKYDIIMYFSNIINASYQTTARIQWKGIVAQEGPYYTNEIPTLMVSLGNPYSYVDEPMIKTLINTYNASAVIVDQVIEKIMGKSSFKGISPIDPFCSKFGEDI